ncbi:YtxH domain-containing protein [Bacillus sp. NEB1478]|uniref:YtxH domain-containing protein n=1 Tax=Bacillus sp. NEB1478 TaxID=3073816 RepID=UPI00287389DC|nr:YtxH domain-containing protein [Bacillus sp. NEB1478]WNB90764.1 YtxH domain-containing protein [Bacillus sp. NEB1478]
MHNETTTTATAEPVFTHSDYQTQEAAENKGSGFATGLVLGGLAGAAAALLLAPKKGNELREDLRDSSIKLKERTMQMKDETMLKAKLGKMDAKDGVDSMKEKSTNLSVSARQKLQEAKNKASEMKKDTKDAVNEAKEEAKKDNYSTQSTSTSSNGLSAAPTSSVTVTKTGTDETAYAKKQSDLNK